MTHEELEELVTLLWRRVTELEARIAIRAGSMGHDTTDSAPVVLTDASSDAPGSP